MFADDVDIRVAIELDVSTGPIGFVAAVMLGTGFLGSELLLESVGMNLRIIDAELAKLWIAEFVHHVRR